MKGSEKMFKLPAISLALFVIYLTICKVAMFVPRGKVCKIKKKFADRLLMSLKLREKEETYIRENEGDKEVSL